MHLLPSHEPRFGSLASPAEAGKCNYPILSYPCGTYSRCKARQPCDAASVTCITVKSFNQFSSPHQSERGACMGRNSRSRCPGRRARLLASSMGLLIASCRPRSHWARARPRQYAAPAFSAARGQPRGPRVPAPHGGLSGYSFALIASCMLWSTIRASSLVDQLLHFEVHIPKRRAYQKGVPGPDRPNDRQIGAF